MPDYVRVLLPKVAGYLATLLAAYLATKDIHIGQDELAKTITLVLSVAVGVGGAVKTLLSLHFNPGNVTSPKMAGEIHADLTEAKKNGGS